MGKALWDPHPTGTDLRARQLAAALGYPLGWRVVRTIEEQCIVDRIYSARSDMMWVHHEAAMQAAEQLYHDESLNFKGGHYLPRLPLYDKGDKVQVLYEGEWWDAKILRRKEHPDGFRYQVHYQADNSRQSGVDEQLIRHRPAEKSPEEMATELGLDGWQAFSTGKNKWKIISSSGKTYTSKKAALSDYLNDEPKDSGEQGDPPWRTTGNDYLGRHVLWVSKHSVSARRTVQVEQIGQVTGWISETDVDKAGEPGFVSERTNQPARLYHVVFEDDPHHPYASHLVQSQDLEEYELLECLLSEDEYPPKKKMRK